LTGIVEEHCPIDDDGDEYMVMYCDGDAHDVSAVEMMQLVKIEAHIGKLLRLMLRALDTLM
jgi:hypothetical protein